MSDCQGVLEGKVAVSPGPAEDWDDLSPADWRPTGRGSPPWRLFNQVRETVDLVQAAGGEAWHSPSTSLARSPSRNWWPGSREAGRCVGAD